ncbi:protein kinase domain-containing protein [Parafrigoribacterium soli]|uniref:protein kinase domain-containing protein n=1 Tax=Parafrigoribacterium soli TaxID=3144663 RepID=UPI0032EAD14E
MRPTSGLTFGGRYQLSSRIAIGGMGEVWQATDLVIGRTVAIKILKDEYLGDPGFLERFRAEARHAALVNHEGIANVFDYGEEDGSAYLVMELVPGEALSTILERERVLSTDRVLDIVAQTASALHAAHSAGLVHRDIKPGNLLITPDGRVKITDFGIARIADQVPLTATGQVMGTVQYLSPEQASGRPASPTTDIYSLGIVAYEALAGRRPFTGESQVAIAMAQINEKAPDLPVTVSEPVRNLVYSCIAKNPADRPASAQHLARAAQALRRGDVGAAVAAVPGVAGADTATAATVAFGAAAGGYGATQATSILPSMAASTATTTTEQTTQSKGRNPWTWPLIALIGILLVVLVGTLIALLASPGPPKSSPSATVTQSKSPTPTPKATPTNSRIQVLKSDFEGKTEAEARDALDKLGLSAAVNTGKAAESTDQVGLVYDVNPTGWVNPGSTITVTLYGDVPTPAKPATPTASPAGPYTPGQQVTVTWSPFQCQYGTKLDSYTVAVSPGSVSYTPANPVPPDQNKVTVTLPSDPAGSTTTVQYLAQCSGTKSPPSDGVTLTVPPAPAG